MRRFSRFLITCEGIMQQSWCRKGSLFNCLVSRLKSCFVILCLLFLLTCVGVAEGRKKHARCSSSCGHLHNISSPFRLKGDPPQCGSPNYTILCDGGKPMLELGSAKYYVTNISYVTNKYCLLPLQSPPPEFSDLYLNVEGFGALFVNCTGSIFHDNWYQRVPCPSSNSSFVYVSATERGFSMDRIEPSCGALAWIPIILSTDRALRNLTATHIFELLKKGFKLSWDIHQNESDVVVRQSTSVIIHECLKEAKRSVGQ